MRPLPIFASATDLGISLQSVGEAARAALADPANVRLEDGVVARGGHPAVNRLAAELQPTVREATGDRFLQPATTHVLQYDSGSPLPRHRDRGNLDVTLSILLRLDGQERWRLRFERGRGRPEGSHPQIEGDAFIMDGKLRTHWRDPLEGGKAVVVMCHYERPGGMVSLEPDIPRAEIRGFLEWAQANITGRRWYHGSILGATQEQLEVWATRRAVLLRRRGGWEAHMCGRMDEVLAFGHPNLEPLDYVQLTTYTPEMGEAGGHFDWHVDSRGGARDEPAHLAKRRLSGSLVLEGPEEGGALEIKDAPLAPQTTGSAILFPSVMTSHRVTPVTRGRRISLVAWAYRWGVKPRRNPFLDRPR